MSESIDPVDVEDIEPSAAELDEAVAEPDPETESAGGEPADDGNEDPAQDPGEGSAQLPGIIAARLVDPRELVSAIEAILFVVETPLTVTNLAASLQQTTDSVQTALDTLRVGYDERNAGVDLREIAGGVRLYTRPAHAEIVEHFLQDGQRSRLSHAALETLAVIAYRQPVTRGRVSAIRGVNVDGVVRTLLARGLVVEVGVDDETGGGLYRTSELFLEKMGLDSLDELPSLAPLLPDIDGLDGIEADV